MISVGHDASIPAQVYHERRKGVVSASALSRFSRSPAHYISWLIEQQEHDTPALVFGRAVHCAVLEPHLFDSLFPVIPKFSGTGSVAARNEWKDSIGHWATTITGDMQQDVLQVSDAIRAHPVVKAALATQGALCESTVAWYDLQTNLMCKARPDLWLPSGIVLDLKTTDDARPQAFARSIQRYRYGISAAHYTEGFKAIGKPIAGYILVAAEKSPPYAVQTYRLGPRSESACYYQYRREVEAFADCVKADEWPGYPTQTTDIELSNWSLREIEEA